MRWILVLLVVVAGCSASHNLVAPTTTGAGGAHAPVMRGFAQVPLPTEPPNTEHMQALISGTLKYRGQCFRIGSAVIVWPNGYSAEARPLRIIDATRHVVTRVGQRISLGGGGAPTDLTPSQLFATYPPLRNCYSEMGCYQHPSQPIRCRNSVWLG